MPAWVKRREPQMRNKGAFANSTANDFSIAGGAVVGLPVPVTRDNKLRQFFIWRQDTGRFISLPFDVPCFDASGNLMVGFRLDCQRVVAVVHDGVLKLWLLHFYSNEQPVRDLVVYDTGYHYVP